MQKFIRIHDKVNQYKGSCSLPITSISIDEETDVFIIFEEKDKDYIRNCISRLEGINIINNELNFSLLDYHFTIYCE